MEKPWKVIAAFIGVFVAGAVFGGFFSIGMGARWLARESPAPTVPAVVAPGPAQRRPVQKWGKPVAHPPLLQVPQSWQAPQLLRRYAERLDLTPEQKQRINPLIQRATEDYNRLRQTTFRETAIILQRLQHDLAEELTPEQRQTLMEFERRQAEALRRQLELRRAMMGEHSKQPGNHPPENKPAPAAKPAAAPSGPADASKSAAPAQTTSTGSSGSEKQD